MGRSAGPVPPPGDVPDLPERPYDHQVQVPILDLAGTFYVPYDESNGVKSFQVIIGPRGKITHVCNMPGKYVSDGEVSVERAFQFVYFIAATRRSPEVIIGFISRAVGENYNELFVESLALPLHKKANSFEYMSNIRPFSDVAGFSNIPVPTII